MKAEVVRSTLEAAIDHVLEPELKMIEYRDVMRNGALRKVPFWKVGAIIDRPDSHRLVGLGYCRPADDECAARCKRWTDRQADVDKAHERLAAGISPDDFPLFDSGYISGYNDDGSYKPGPKWEEYAAQLAAEAAEEDEDDE